MPRESLRYDKLVEAALRGVVRDALREAAEHGLPGDHHFYLTFRTSFPGVDIPDYLAAQYPGDMTIVVQYQYHGLQADDRQFEIMLSFNNVLERLVVPYAAITTFADPSVNFALQFQPMATDDDLDLDEEDSAEITALPQRETRGNRTALRSVDSEDTDETGEEEVKRGEVVTLDAFRKK